MQSNSRTIFPVVRTFEISFENVTDFFFRNSDAVIFKSDYRLITFFQNRDFNFPVVRREFESIRQEVEIHFVHQVSVDIKLQIFVGRMNFKLNISFFGLIFKVSEYTISKIIDIGFGNS